MINLLYAGNSGVFDGLIIGALSYIKHNKNAANVYILTMDYTEKNPRFTPITEADRVFLEAIYRKANDESRVFLIDAGDYYKKEMSDSPNGETGYTPYTFLRLFADIIPGIPEKILYLDTDTLIADDLSELYSADISEYELAAALDYYGHHFLGHNYFNAGVLLLNMKSIRESGLFRRAVAACAKKKIFLPDQTALNRLVKKKLLLPAKYNEQKHFRDDTVIQHFSKTILWLPYFHTRNIKPWQTEAVQTVLTKKYDDILEEYKKMKLIYEKELHRGEIPIFFACDDNYLPYLAVALKSLILHADNKRKYHIYVLCDSVSAEMAAKITAMATENVKAEFVSVTEKMVSILGKMRLRDYYTPSIYYRIFIAKMFPEFDKAIYIDADIVLNDDIAKLFDTELGGNLLGVVPDAIIASTQLFRDYAELGLGIRYDRYFNSGVLLMNLHGMREYDVEGKFLYLLNRYHFNTVCPDQDYLNVICRDKVLYLDEGWDKMSLNENYPGVPSLIHYNMFNKPWYYDNVPYDAYFWKYCEGTPFEAEIKAGKAAYGEEKMAIDKAGGENLCAQVTVIINDENNFRRVLCEDEDGEAAAAGELVAC